MIGCIQGEVWEVNEDNLIVLAGGLGYQVYVPLANFAVLPSLGQSICLYTQLQFSTQPRAEALTLFGFEDKQSLRLFNLLLGVSGVGAKTALAALNTCGYAGLVNAVQTGNAQALLKIPGVGKKAAERILLELRDKVMKLEPDLLPDSGAAPAAVNSMAANVRRTAALALTQLGYSQTAAEHYVEGVADKLPEDAALEEIITAALQLAAQE